jgi:MFS family permease
LIARRWIALAILFISFLQFTLNWFSVIPAFPAMTGELALDLPQIALVVSAFMAGYGITHIPGGLLAGAFGIRAALLLGIALETIGAGLTAAAPNYETLVLARGLSAILNSGLAGFLCCSRRWVAGWRDEDVGLVRVAAGLPSSWLAAGAANRQTPHMR